jgi:hypothetical protein
MHVCSSVTAVGGGACSRAVGTTGNDPLDDRGCVESPYTCVSGNGL